MPKFEVYYTYTLKGNNATPHKEVATVDAEDAEDAVGVFLDDMQEFMPEASVQVRRVDLLD